MKQLLILLVSGLLISSTHATDDGSFLSAHKKKICALASVITHCVLRSSSSNYKEATDKVADQAKDFLICKVIAPVLSKIEYVKHEGLSKRDIMYGGVFLSVMAVIVAHLKLYKMDVSVIKECLQNDIDYISEHRVPAGIIAVLSGSSLIAYIEGLNMPHIQQFLSSLSSRQKKAIASSEQLRTLLDKVHDDPKALLEHDALQELLHDHQKDLLDKAVQEHIINNNPFSLLDEIDL